MNVPLIVAGSLGLVAAAIHGVGGELLVVRKLSTEVLPRSHFGGPRMTMAMIHVTWHLTTIAFFTLGAALLLSGAVLHGDSVRAIAVLGASAFTGFGVLAIGLGVRGQSPRALIHHPGPVVLAAIGALAWWGAL